jgi:hypothetical protein
VTAISFWAFKGCSSLTSVVFENPNGWWLLSDVNATSGTNIDAAELADATTAAEYLKRYYSYYWKRS